MHKILKTFLLTSFFTGMYFLTSGSFAVVFNNIHYVFDFPKNIDSISINKLYSEKNIKFVNPQTLEEESNRIFVNIKAKPLNPSIISQGKLIKNKNFNNLNLDENFDVKNLSLAKIKFIETLLPLISYENEKILFDRKKILSLRHSLLNNKTLTNQELSYLRKISAKYKVKSDNKHKIDLIDDLLVSVDIIPNSIVLAQAAKESGWGTSRFALEGNAIFGQWTWDGQGIAPLKRDGDKNHKILKFPILRASVKAYKNNLNTHKSYLKFREKRKSLRSKNKNITGLALTDTLKNYAQTGSEYTKILNQIITQNRLSDFEPVRLVNSVKQVELNS